MNHKTMRTQAANLFQSIALMRMTVLMLTAIGVLSLAVAALAHGWQDSAGEPFDIVKEQLMWLLAASLAGVAAASVDYHWWKKAAPWLGGIATLLLVLVFLEKPDDGSCRWLTLGATRFQPSELAKLAMVVCLAAWADRRIDDLRTGKLNPTYPILALALIVVLILMEPDKGTGILLVIAGLTVLFAAGADRSILTLTALVVILVSIVHIQLNPLAMGRFLAWWEPAANPALAFQAEAAFQALQRGVCGGAHLNALIKAHAVLPEAPTVFILATVGEYLGCCGIAVVILLFVLFYSSAVRIVTHTPDRFGHLLGIGIIVLIAVQAFLNVTYVMGIAPIRGLPLPFLSYGGSGLLVTFIEVGILESIGQRAIWAIGDIPETERLEKRSNPV